MMEERGRPAPEATTTSLQPTEGWHCAHFFYRFRHAVLETFDAERRSAGRQEFLQALDPHGATAPARLQTSIASGHRADFGLMLMDPDPLKIDAVHQRLVAGPLGSALEATYSFISMTEISEYVPSVEQYRQRLLDEGEPADSPALLAKVKAYERREPMMRHQRLTPDFPLWPATCFYPMNKKRHVGENWFLLEFAARNRLMAEHARSGMSFAGKVSQLITVAVGFDDWEWGVTLWATNPEYLKDIVYRMRFDEASARYAEFGPFYVSYLADADAILRHCRVVT
ncbi:MAG: hydrogen peroxide-dependent heme synthase [Pirellulaceae bacterium]